MPPPTTSQESQAVDSSGAAEAPKADESTGGEQPAAKTEDSLELHFSLEGGLVLNGLQLSDKAGASELTKRLGAPTREKARPRGEVSHYHDQQGLVLWTVDGELAGVGLNFNWDGDDKFPETSFTGSLTVGDLQVGRETTLTQFQSLKEASVSCLGDSMCAGKSGSTKFLVGFEKNVITQVSFLFSK